MRVLLAEDDPLLGDGLKAALLAEGYTVDWFRDGQQSLYAALDEAFDIVILDLGLPGLDGLEVLRALRDRKKDVPVLILTARDALDDRVRGLDLGADDYLTKPFDLDELAARRRSLIRRSHGRSVTLLEFAEISLDPAAQTVSKGGKDVELTLKEFQACLRPRDRFWDIPVPKIDSAFDNLLVPQTSWSPSTTQQLRKLVA
ncbi:response regulator, partial [Thiolapillus sp.]